MIRLDRRYTLGCVVLLLGLSTARATPGSITGQVIHASEHTAIAEAVVWAEPVGTMQTFPPPAQPAEMAQAHLAFVPRVLPVLVGTIVAFPNRDTVYHSVFSFARQQRFEIGLYPPGESRSVTLDTPGLVKVFCNIHDQMFGAILVLSTPYFSTSTAQGGFTLPHLPAGATPYRSGMSVCTVHPSLLRSRLAARPPSLWPYSQSAGTSEVAPCRSRTPWGTGGYATKSLP